LYFLTYKLNISEPLELEFLQLELELLQQLELELLQQR
jgi:hypothetical protein